MSVFCTDLKLEFDGKTVAARLVHANIKKINIGRETTRSVFQSHQGPDWGFEQSVFGDFNWSMTSYRQKYASLQFTCNEKQCH